MMNEFPASWVLLPVSEVVRNITLTDKKIPQKNYLSSGKFPVFDQGQEFVGGYTDDAAMVVDCDLPVIVFGDHTRAVKLVNTAFAPGADGVKVLQPSACILPKLLEHFVRYLITKIPNNGYARHYQHLAKSLLPIPPLAEQHRIVAKIEELFSELDQGVASLKTAREQLKVYRQSLLKNAFEGKLTAAWRTAHRDQLETATALQQRIARERQARYQQQLADWQTAGQAGPKPKPPKPLPPLSAEELAELPELPAGWAYSYLADMGDLGRGKSKHRPRNDPRLFGGSFPFIQTGEVKAANRVIRSHSQTYSDFGLAQSKLWPKGTLCITIAANIAETAFLGFEGCFPDSVVGFTAFEPVVRAEYIDYFIQAARTRIEAYAPATAQKNINLETLENLVVPYCSNAEQEAVLCELESKLSEADQLDQTLATALQQADALRQSILKKAFRGQLEKQDKNEEPATALLERIRAAKSNGMKKPGKQGNAG